ncbi:serine/threonine phosphatase [Nodosilinea sp. LEGE 07088]|uniref:serine/threonine phosphatase n=1 Tax=Nodosilinea sp. LEGE 07088 TaxID=2777968 RepID=UPI0018821F4A|nr:serine/threonine phosphatase [Nodosilinea sp. LEGE 07088]MBE9138297.1 serine/threonine phosphatase [Nodosilinea sp. LEGE 07088]
MIDIPDPGAVALSLPPDDTEHYIDDDKRYRVISPGSPGMTVAAAASLTVIDCQPRLASPLQALQQAWLESPDLDPSDHPLATKIPAVAYPYLALQADYFPAVPELHHAWQTRDRTILLVENRSSWLPLSIGWSAIDDPLQHIQWLFETTLLWEALAPWQGQSTLLNAERLTLNENSLLCLTQIDQVAHQPPLSLQTLGYMWQSMLGVNFDSLPATVQVLIEAVAEGTATDIKYLKDALAEVARAYQQPEPDAPGRDWSDTELDASVVSAINAESDLEPDLLVEELDFDAVFDTQESSDDDGNAWSIEAPTMVLPMKLATLDDAGKSHVGQQRHHNEDWFFTQTQLHKVSGPKGVVLRSKGFYVLCDGMGGHASGEVASQLAVSTLRDYLAEHWSDQLPDQGILSEAVLTANQAIFDINQSQATSGIGRMGTTLVMALVHNLDVAVVHVGDSRLYSYSRRLGLRQLTLDHEVGQREINRGVEPELAYARPDAYQLTQALGPRGKEDLSPSIAYHEITEDTLLLLCSDGLSDNDLLERHVDSHIADLLSSKANLDHGVAQLIDLANEKNGHDNITAILIRIKLQPDLAPQA